jgi:hypothetical protein
MSTVRTSLSTLGEYALEILRSSSKLGLMSERSRDFWHAPFRDDKAIPSDCPYIELVCLSMNNPDFSSAIEEKSEKEVSTLTNTSWSDTLRVNSFNNSLSSAKARLKDLPQDGALTFLQSEVSACLLGIAVSLAYLYRAPVDSKLLTRIGADDEFPDVEFPPDLEALNTALLLWEKLVNNADAFIHPASAKMAYDEIIDRAIYAIEQRIKEAARPISEVSLLGEPVGSMDVCAEGSKEVSTFLYPVSNLTFRCNALVQHAAAYQELLAELTYGNTGSSINSTQNVRAEEGSTIGSAPKKRTK